ncbi:hypothetical protein EPA93_01645 [Ktedonosporobacter rubrisoli]|uniref:Uncharacterized protein n=1 Tax=Ktedonosporobacter rubrisoli TaxID=2509675 RepID=A0A4P6JIG0_KTERU|nr:hypothetical protein [Ktedonosporobacter rubrisoli]QBD74763.1 hypothetical protein EPA93_01645 [Ktedonosporobacter rubrisoli]
MGQNTLRPGRVIGIFLVGYIAISVTGALLNVLLGALLVTPPSLDTPTTFSYVLYEICLVLLNIGWIPLSLWYFKGRADIGHVRKEALIVGLLWAAMAALVDFLFFALLPGPLHLGAYKFFVVQFPWIYMIYILAFLSPFISTELRKNFAKGSTVSHAN